MKELSKDDSSGGIYDAKIVALLWSFTRPYKGMLAASLLSYPVASALQMVQPYLVKVAIDEHLMPKRMTGFGSLILGYIACVALEAAARYLQTSVTQLLGQTVTRDLRVALFRRLQRVDIAFLEANPVGRLMTRLTTDVEAISELFSSGAVNVLGDFFTFAGIMAVMLSMSVRLTLYAFAVLPVLVTVVLVFRRYSRMAMRAVRTHLARMNAFLNEAISGMSIVQVFRQEARLRKEFEELNRDHRDASLRAVRFDAAAFAIVEAISTIAVALVLLLGHRMFARGAAEIGMFVAFVEYLRRFFGPITELSTKYSTLQSAVTSAERCFDLLQQEPHLKERIPAASMGPFSTAIELRDVSFAYGKAPVLRAISLTLRRGEKVAIVGPTGAGKSTIIKLIARFYDPSSGKITLDGLDLRDISIGSLRSKLAIVLQDAYLFQGTVRENIAFGTRGASDEELSKAAERTQALQLVESLPEKWSTKIGDRSGALSSGERQLIAFARALAADPEILVLDEATSSVDPETESRIQRALEALLAERTAIIIAHRLSTIRRVDRIIVLVQGRIVEEGSHHELMASDGVYKKLYELQFAETVEPAA
jgi:ATP-binding cassette subfamily B protein